MRTSSTISFLFLMTFPFVTQAAEQSLFTRSLNAWMTQHTVHTRLLGIESEIDAFYGSDDLLPTLRSNAQTPSSQRGSDGVLSLTIAGKNVRFTDVSTAAWYAPYIRSAIESGLLRGYSKPDGTPRGLFGPQDPVTLEQVAKVLVEATIADPTACPKDARNVSAQKRWSERFVSCAEAAQWPVIGEGSFDLTLPATRLQVVALIMVAYRVPEDQTAVQAFNDVPQSMEFSAAVAAAKRDGLITGYVDQTTGMPTGNFGPDALVNRAEFSKMMVSALEIYGTNHIR